MHDDPFYSGCLLVQAIKELIRQLPGQKAASNAWVSELALFYAMEFSFYICSALVIVPHIIFFFQLRVSGVHL